MVEPRLRQSASQPSIEELPQLMQLQSKIEPGGYG
jgi:hypothetical protein